MYICTFCTWHNQHPIPLWCRETELMGVPSFESRQSWETYQTCDMILDYLQVLVYFNIVMYLKCVFVLLKLHSSYLVIQISEIMSWC